MMNEAIPSRKVVSGAILVYLLLGAVMLPFYRYQVAPDAISYYSIARHYLAGNWSAAINGYWGPMLSWLLVPFLAVGLPDVIAAKILSLLVGAGLLLAVNRLITIYALPLLIRGVVLFSCIPLVLYFAWYNLSPDLLLGLTLTMYCCLIFNDSYLQKTWPGILCGVLGALAYFCKQYGFMFFGAHFVLFSIWLFIRAAGKAERKQVAVNFLLGMCVFIVLSGCWVGALNAKYGHPTLGTAGGYNQAILGPHSVGHTHHNYGFLPLPNEEAVSAWEDPSFFPYEPWNPLGSPQAIFYTLKHVLHNLGALVNVYLIISIFSLTAMLGVVLLSMGPWSQFRMRKEWYPLGVLAVFSGGYTLVLIDLRFFPVAAVLTVLMAGIVIHALLAHPFFSRFYRTLVLLVAVFLSFALYPGLKLLGHFNTGREYHQRVPLLSTLLGENKRWASDEDWYTSLYYAYLTGNQYLGKANADWSTDDLQHQLDEFAIDYYLVWDKDDAAMPYLQATYPEIKQETIPGLRIFDIARSTRLR